MLNESIRKSPGRLESESETPAAPARPPALDPVDPVMQMVLATALQVAPTDETILLLGETGVGKDVMARRIHEASPRSRGPFVTINCAALPEGLLESELFGHMRGAYTGAVDSRPGMFEVASGGTLFLDEIGELSPRLQAKLLHVLQEKRFCRVGGRETIVADVRVIAATNQDLDSGMASGAFRRDLFYRLSVVSLRIPSLRERPSDIAALARHFALRYATLYRREHLARVEEPALALLLQHRFDGNVRELENLIKRAILLGSYSHILDELSGQMATWRPAAANASTGVPPQAGSGVAAAPMPLREVAKRAVEDAERRALTGALERTGWNRRRAAQILRISYRSMLYKIREYSLMPLGEAEADLDEAIVPALSPREGSC